MADPCYHAHCGDLDNLDLGVLNQMAAATATAVATFARDPGRSTGPASGAEGLADGEQLRGLLTPPVPACR